MKDTLPDNRDVCDICDVRDVLETRAGRDIRGAPLAAVAVSVGLATHALVPCLAAGGLPGVAALLAASVAALFGVLLVIVSVSVVAAIAAMLFPPVAGAARYTAFSSTSRSVGAGAAPPPAATLAPLSRDAP